MNKILPYIVIAILLGTLTMVVPYALFGPSDYTSMTEGNTLIQPSPEPTSAPTESSNPMTIPEPVPSPVPSPTPETSEERGDFSSSDSLAPSPSALTETPTPVPSPLPDASEPVPSPAPTTVPSPIPEASEPEPSQSEEPTSAETEAPLAPQPAFGGTDLIAESMSHLSAIGLMIVPSFLIALGAFIYLKKRRS